MRTLVLGSLAAAMLAGTTASADACSIRGQFCGYPPWAANAFEAPWGRVNLNASPILPGVGDYETPRAYHYAPRRHDARRAAKRR